MPTAVTRWACDVCGTLYDTYLPALAHEKVCVFNVGATPGASAQLAASTETEGDTSTTPTYRTRLRRPR